jgi:hypothetical protein
MFDRSKTVARRPEPTLRAVELLSPRGDQVSPALCHLLDLAICAGNCGEYGISEVVHAFGTPSPALRGGPQLKSDKTLICREFLDR